MKFAKKEDLPAIQAIYNQAIERAHSAGGYIDWPYPFPVSRIKEFYDDKSLYMFTENNEAVAAVRVYKNGNQKIWPDVDAAEALYLGKVATSDEISGRNYLLNHILPEIISFAAEYQYKYVRFDSIASNTGLSELYNKSPFSNIGTATIYSTDSAGLLRLIKWQYSL